MSRCIDADALEKEGWSLHRDIRVDKNTWEYQTKPLRQVPTIEPEPHWISCSERLPEFKYETYDKEDDFTYWDTDVVMGSTNIGMLTLGVFCRDSNHPNEYHWDSIEAGRPFDMCGLAVGVHVIAWMPLPKPYTEDKE